MKTKTLAAVVAMLVVSASSVLAQQIAWNDNFESYADTAALSPTYTQLYPAVPFLLDTTKGYMSNQSIHDGKPAANNSARMYFNLPTGPKAATDDMPIKVEFMVDLDAAYWYTRDWIEIRSYSGGAYGVGTLNQLFMLGFQSSSVDTTLINRRIVNGPNAGYGNLTATYATRATIAAEGNDWTKLGMWIKSSTIEYYVNGNLDTTLAITPGLMYDSIVIGSGYANQTDVWFDNLRVTVPEPSTFALSLLGGLGLLWSSRRRTA